MKKKIKQVNGVVADILSDNELKALSDVLDYFERVTKKETAVSMISGGFAEAEMFNFDNDYVDIELKWGVQSDCQNSVNVENYKLARNILLKKMSVKKKYLEIEDA